MKPWFTKEGDIIDFPKKKDNVIKLPNINNYDSFIDGVRDLHSKLRSGDLSQVVYDKLYTDLIQRFGIKKENVEHPWFIKESVISVLHEDARSDFKRWLTLQLKNAGIGTTASSRGGVHIRFPLQGEPKEFKTFFNQLGINIADSPSKISGTYDTYVLTLQKPIEKIPAGTQLLWVNNYVGKDSKINKTFGPKDLTPESLGLADTRLEANQILQQINNPLMEKYPDQHKTLIEIAKRVASSSGKVISLSGIDLSAFSGSDLATVSKNYGEVLAGIWSTKNLNFNKIYFPKLSNAKLIDFYGEQDKVDLPVSVKSGGGGKVTVGNILEALEDKVQQGKVNPKEQKCYTVFKTVQENGAREGIVALHRQFNTKPIQLLSQIMRTTVDKIDLESIADWLNTFKNNNDIRKKLQPLLQSMNTTITDAIWAREDRLRFVISPLGEYLWKFLNQNEEIRGSMTNLARELSIVQVNVDIKRGSLIFNYNRFEKAEFIFGWAGYAAGNRLGFKMDLN